jgi:hypothetical protein
MISPFITRLFALLVASGPLVAAAADDDSPYRINVNSTVERAYTRFSKEPYREHGKVYAIISLKEGVEATFTRWNPNPLAKPVNESVLLAQLRHALTSRGFREVESGKKPDIVLTVLYGRSHLVNPYTGGFTPLGLDGLRAIVGTPDKIEAETLGMPGGAAKIISASAEKLFIAVSAWKYPETAQEKPVLIWRTIMKTDDPDEDLNLLSDKMLMAGAALFDHPTDEPEVAIPSDLPEGHVKVGTPTVVEPSTPGK